MDENRIDFEKDSKESIHAKLKRYSEMDVRTVDPHTFVDMNDVYIDT